MQQQQARPQPASESTSIEIDPLINNPQHSPSAICPILQAAGSSAAPFFFDCCPCFATLRLHSDRYSCVCVGAFWALDNSPTGPAHYLPCDRSRRFCLPSFESLLELEPFHQEEQSLLEHSKYDFRKVRPSHRLFWLNPFVRRPHSNRMIRTTGISAFYWPFYQQWLLVWFYLLYSITRAVLTSSKAQVSSSRK